jgi:hypothetical protein
MASSEPRGLTERKVALLIARGVSYLVYFWLIVVEIILLMGFVLLLFGANPSAAFTQWVYRNLDRVMAPFRGIFTPIQIGTTASDVPAIFETSVLFAMIVYGILALAMSALIGWLSGRLAGIHREEERLEYEARVEQQRQDAEARRISVEQAAYQGALAGQTAGSGVAPAAMPATPAPGTQPPVPPSFGSPPQS